MDFATFQSWGRGCRTGAGRVHTLHHPGASSLLEPQKPAGGVLQLDPGPPQNHERVLRRQSVSS